MVRSVCSNIRRRVSGVFGGVIPRVDQQGRERRRKTQQAKRVHSLLCCFRFLFLYRTGVLRQFSGLSLWLGRIVASLRCLVLLFCSFPLSHLSTKMALQQKLPVHIPTSNVSFVFWFLTLFSIVRLKKSLPLQNSRALFPSRLHIVLTRICCVADPWCAAC